jgi:heptosyltransferase-2
MKVGLDARSMTTSRPRGTGRNLRDAYRLIPRLRPDWEFVLYHQRPVADREPDHDQPWRHPHVRLRQLEMPGDRLDAWFQVRLPLAAWQDRVDLMHFPANRAPLWCPVPFVATIHDLAPLEVRGELPPAQTRAFRRDVARAVRGAVHIITVSSATRDSLHRVFGLPLEKMTVIPWAPDERIAAEAAGDADPEQQRRVRERWLFSAGGPERDAALDLPYLITFSGRSPRKNATGVLDGLARMSADLRRSVQLVLLGCEPQSYRTSLALQAKRLGIAKQCHILGFVPHADLPALLRGARGLLIPSRCEGFGLPVLDAFACGVPVLASRASSLPEVAGPAAVYCDPNDADSIAAGMEQLLDRLTAARLVSSGYERLKLFSWERTAEAMCAVYEQCLRRVPASPRAGPPMTGRALQCRNYRGDRPCAAGVQGICPAVCQRSDPMGTRILIIKLGALGDVIRTAALLPGLKEAWPQSHITWVTRPNGARTLANHPLIDRLLALDAETLAHLEHERFDLCLSLDKEPGPAGLAMRVDSPDKRGIGLSPFGTPYPLNQECAHYFELGLDDDLKFHRNERTYQDLIYEAVGLRYRGQRYRLYPSADQRAQAARRWRELGVRDDQVVIGLNTGAGRVFANKNWPPDKYAALARLLTRRSGWRVALLGGPEERRLNADLAATCPGVLDTGCDHDELEFAALLQRCQVIVTGDTMAMHVAVACDVPCVVLFGPTCEQEIDLYGRGEKVRTGLPCSPCYRRRCDRSPNCMDDIDVQRVLAAVERWAEAPSARDARAAEGARPVMGGPGRPITGAALPVAPGDVPRGALATLCVATPPTEVAP